MHMHMHMHVLALVLVLVLVVDPGTAIAIPGAGWERDHRFRHAPPRRYNLFSFRSPAADHWPPSLR
jgi:hypothetical protein